MAIQTWQYQVVKSLLSEDQLNDLGQDGWELVTVAEFSTGLTATYLKRPTLGFKEQVTLEQRDKYARLQGYDMGNGSS